MKVNNIQTYDNTQFGQRFPKKQTYRAMKKYYLATDDRGMSTFYAFYENVAKTRLHKRKYVKAQQAVIDLSEKFSDKPLTSKCLLRYVFAQARNSFMTIKETALTTFYKSKRISV